MTSSVEGEISTRQGSSGRSLHTLISAYACDPTKGSEAGIGWNWVRHISDCCYVSVITRVNNRDAIDTWLQRHTLPNVRFYYVDLPRHLSVWKRGVRGVYLYYAIWQLLALQIAKRIHLNNRCDIAHHITFGSLHMPIFLQHLSIPLVYGPVGGGEMSPRTFQAGGGWQASVYEQLRRARMTTVRWDPLVLSTLRKASRILVTTPETASCIPGSFASKTSVMLAAGAELVDGEPVPDRYGSSCRVYTAGRLLHWKGFHLAIEAFARVATRYPHVTLTILGDGPQRLRLEQLAVRLGLSDRIQIKRWLPRAEVLQVASSSDIFLYPSLHDSGGMAVLEAMAVGKPVICLDSGGPGMMITQECGIKVPLTDPVQVVTDLAEALERLVADPCLRQRLGEVARQRVMKEFSWEHKAAQMHTLYREVVGQALVGAQ